MGFVLTGGFGSGKTAILEALRADGCTVAVEPARAVLAEQRAINGDGVYERNRQKFFDLMLERAIDDFQSGASFFDRGIPDLIAYAHVFEIDPAPAQRACETRRYNDSVFFLPSWREIYTNDDERKATFEQAAMFGDLVREVYARLDYAIVDVPLASIDERVRFVRSNSC